MTRAPDASTDVIIAGAGVMGLFCAYYASARGARVTMLERGRIGDPTTVSFARRDLLRRWSAPCPGDGRGWRADGHSR